MVSPEYWMRVTSYDVDPMKSLTLENVLSVAKWKQKWKLKVESNLSWVPEKSYKILTRHVGNQIL